MGRFLLLQVVRFMSFIWQKTSHLLFAKTAFCTCAECESYRAAREAIERALIDDFDSNDDEDFDNLDYLNFDLSGTVEDNIEHVVEQNASLQLKPEDGRCSCTSHGYDTCERYTPEYLNQMARANHTQTSFDRTSARVLVGEVYGPGETLNECVPPLPPPRKIRCSSKTQETRISQTNETTERFENTNSKTADKTADKTTNKTADKTTDKTADKTADKTTNKTTADTLTDGTKNTNDTNETTIVSETTVVSRTNESDESIEQSIQPIRPDRRVRQQPDVPTRWFRIPTRNYEIRKTDQTNQASNQTQAQPDLINNRAQSYKQVYDEPILVEHTQTADTITQRNEKPLSSSRPRYTPKIDEDDQEAFSHDRYQDEQNSDSDQSEDNQISGCVEEIGYTADSDNDSDQNRRNDDQGKRSESSSNSSSSDSDSASDSNSDNSSSDSEDNNDDDNDSSGSTSTSSCSSTSSSWSGDSGESDEDNDDNDRNGGNNEYSRVQRGGSNKSRHTQTKRVRRGGGHNIQIDYDGSNNSDNDRDDCNITRENDINRGYDCANVGEKHLHDKIEESDNSRVDWPAGYHIKSKSYDASSKTGESETNGSDNDDSGTSSLNERSNEQGVPDDSSDRSTRSNQQEPDDDASSSNSGSFELSDCDCDGCYEERYTARQHEQRCNERNMNNQQCPLEIILRDEQIARHIHTRFPDVRPCSISDAQSRRNDRSVADIWYQYTRRLHTNSETGEMDHELDQHEERTVDREAARSTIDNRHAEHDSRAVHDTRADQDTRAERDIRATFDIRDGLDTRDEHDMRDAQEVDKLERGVHDTEYNVEHDIKHQTKRTIEPEFSGNVLPGTLDTLDSLDVQGSPSPTLSTATQITVALAAPAVSAVDKALASSVTTTVYPTTQIASQTVPVVSIVSTENVSDQTASIVTVPTVLVAPDDSSADVPAVKITTATNATCERKIHTPAFTVDSIKTRESAEGSIDNIEKHEQDKQDEHNMTSFAGHSDSNISYDSCSSDDSGKTFTLPRVTWRKRNSIENPLTDKRPLDRNLSKAVSDIPLVIDEMDDTPIRSIVPSLDDDARSCSLLDLDTTNEPRVLVYDPLTRSRTLEQLSIVDRLEIRSDEDGNRSENETHDNESQNTEHEREEESDNQTDVDRDNHYHDGHDHNQDDHDNDHSHDDHIVSLTDFEPSEVLTDVVSHIVHDLVQDMVNNIVTELESVQTSSIEAAQEESVEPILTTGQTEESTMVNATENSDESAKESTTEQTWDVDTGLDARAPLDNGNNNRSQLTIVSVLTKADAQRAAATSNASNASNASNDSNTSNASTTNNASNTSNDSNDSNASNASNDSNIDNIRRIDRDRDTNLDDDSKLEELARVVDRADRVEQTIIGGESEFTISGEVSVQRRATATVDIIVDRARTPEPLTSLPIQYPLYPCYGLLPPPLQELPSPPLTPFIPVFSSTLDVSLRSIEPDMSLPAIIDQSIAGAQSIRGEQTTNLDSDIKEDSSDSQDTDSTVVPILPAPLGFADESEIAEPTIEPTTTPTADLTTVEPTAELTVEPTAELTAELTADPTGAELEPIVDLPKVPIEEPAVVVCDDTYTNTYTETNDSTDDDFPDFADFRGASIVDRSESPRPGGTPPPAYIERSSSPVYRTLPSVYTDDSTNDVSIYEGITRFGESIVSVDTSSTDPTKPLNFAELWRDSIHTPLLPRLIRNQRFATPTFTTFKPMEAQRPLRKSPQINLLESIAKDSSDEHSSDESEIVSPTMVSRPVRHVRFNLKDDDSESEHSTEMVEISVKTEREESADDSVAESIDSEENVPWRQEGSTLVLQIPDHIMARLYRPKKQKQKQKQKQNPQNKLNQQNKPNQQNKLGQQNRPVPQCDSSDQNDRNDSTALEDKDESKPGSMSSTSSQKSTVRTRATWSKPERPIVLSVPPPEPPIDYSDSSDDDDDVVVFDHNSKSGTADRDRPLCRRSCPDVLRKHDHESSNSESSHVNRIPEREIEKVTRFCDRVPERTSFEMEPSPLVEPLLDATKDEERFVLFPVQHPDIYDMYKRQVAQFWTMEEIDLSKDLADWNERLSSHERDFFKCILAFFAPSDGIVGENLVTRFYEMVVYTEARYFYAFQAAMENIHAEVYSQLIKTLIPNEDEQRSIFSSFMTTPGITEKTRWAKQWLERENLSFVERLVAFAVVEGLLFSGSFASIFWLKKRGLMHGLTFSNELISRDEGLHCDFACLLYTKHIVHKLPNNVIYNIVREAVHAESIFFGHALRNGPVGELSQHNMMQYVRFCADRLLTALDVPPLYSATNPFDFMHMISLDGRTNFFERRVGEYRQSRVLTANEREYDESFGLDYDF